MTTPTPAPSVDVLAELDRRIEIGELFGQEHDTPSLPGNAELRNVRAAVSELLEAATDALACMDACNCWPASADELRTAIANCKPEGC